MSDYIPKDIVVHIMRHLPVESLLRFRSVCKWWKQTIDSETFKLEHLALQNPRFLVEYEGQEFLILDFHKLPSYNTLQPPVEDRTRRLRLVGTLHGLVCLYDDVWELFLLWNPCIRKFSILRQPQFMDFDWTGLDDGLSDGTCAGFWFDPFNDILKIVIFKLEQYEQFDEDDDTDLCGGLYSSIERDWKRISISDVQIYHTVEATPPVVIQGVAHWRAQYDFMSWDSEIERDVVVVTFDFVEEQFDRIEAFSVPDGWDPPVLGSIEGGLSIVYVDPNRKCDVYLRSQDSWVHVFGIGVGQCVSRVLWGEVEVGEKKKKKNKCRIVATMGDEMVFFDTKTKSCTTLKKGINDPIRFAMAHDYVESLLYVTKFIKPRS